MKTHELADALEGLAKILRFGKNEEFKDLSRFKLIDFVKARTSDEQLVVNLYTLVNLSKIDKARWKDFIEENSLPIEVKSTYSIRDTLGKILNYLEKNPIAIENIKKNVNKKSGSSVNELDKAFQIFLEDDFSDNKK